MIAISHKSKQYLLVALKVLILVVAIWLIYQRFMETDAQTWTQFKVAFTQKPLYLLYTIPAFLGLTLLNWLFEIKKWQLLVSQIQTINYNTALKQSLGSLTASLATPGRVGEYGAKAVYYPSKKRKQIVLLNLFGNGMQMIVTTAFGILGYLFVINRYPVPVSTQSIYLLIIAAVISIPALYFLRNQKLFVKGVTLKSVFTYFRNLKLNVQLGTFLLSLFRYLTFSGLFFLILQFFGAEDKLLPTSMFIYLMYLLVSVLPSFFIFDVVI